MDDNEEETFEIIEDEELKENKKDEKKGDKKDNKFIRNVVTPAATMAQASSFSESSLNNKGQSSSNTLNSKNSSSTPSNLQKKPNPNGSSSPTSTSKKMSKSVNNVANKLQNLKSAGGINNRHLPSASSNKNQNENLSNEINDGGLQKSKNDDEKKSNSLLKKAGIGDSKKSVSQNAKTAAKSFGNIVAGNKVQGVLEAADLFKNPIKKIGKKMIILTILSFFSIIIIICSIVGTDNIERVMDILNTMNKVEDMIDEFFYHKNTNSNSEEYSNSCIGAISPSLISELSLPVKINSDNVEFTGEYAYGITTAQMHNGVDLNLETTGTKEGDDIYSIADGEVVDIATNISCNKETDENCDSKGSWIKLKHSILIDDTTYEFYSVYMNMQANSSALKKGNKVNKGGVIGKVGKTGQASIAGVHFEFHNENDTPIDPTNLFIPCTNGVLVGDSVEEQIWFYFRNQGYSEAATAGAMGNLQAESGLMPNNLEDASNKKSGFSDEEFTSQVNSGKISKSEFIASSRFGLSPDDNPVNYGYGLAQWTSQGRKENLYKYKEKNNSSIDDLQTQLEYLMTEVSGPGWGSKSKHSVWENSTGDSGVNDAADAYCESFERPAKCNYTDRRKNAKAIYDRNKGKSLSISDVNTTGNNQILLSARKIKTYIRDNKYTYNSKYNKKVPSLSINVTDCSAYVSWVLYDAGYTQFGGSQQSSQTFSLNRWKFKEISKSEVKPGDILVYYGNGLHHVEIYVGMNGNRTKVYNAGTTKSIQSEELITTSAYNLSQTTKILRP